MHAQVHAVCPYTYTHAYTHTHDGICYIPYMQVIILDVRVPSQPVARLGNHRAPINGITWAPHSSCHICTAGQQKKKNICICSLTNKNVIKFSCDKSTVLVTCIKLVVQML